MKKLLLVVVAFISLSAFDVKNVKTPNRDKETRSDMPYLVKPDAKIITPSKGSIIVLEGMSVELEARAVARPEPESRVSKGGTEIKDMENIKIWHGAYTVKVIINNAKLSDSGNYIIEFWNWGGTSSVIISVTVIKKPNEV